VEATEEATVEALEEVRVEALEEVRVEALEEVRVAEAREEAKLKPHQSKLSTEIAEETSNFRDGKKRIA
jgi:hypothetical protein